MREVNSDDIESAKILIQENLFEEAKRILFRLLARHTNENAASYLQAQELLKEIEEVELKDLMMKVATPTPDTYENAEEIITKLSNDLQLNFHEQKNISDEQEKWIVSDTLSSAQEMFDLAVAFFEMGCFADACRELKRAERKIRIESTFLGELGVSVVALAAQARIRMNRAFDAKVLLEPILLEPELPHEQKIILYYSMGLAEQELGEKAIALRWFEKVQESDHEFKDIEQRIKVLKQIT